MDLQVLGRDVIGVGEHGRLAVADGNLAIVAPGGTGHRRGRKRRKLPLNLGQHRVGEGAARAEPEVIFVPEGTLK